MKSTEVKSATVIGTASVLTYMVNYYLRNILSVLNPRLLATGDYEVEFLALLSSTYMFCYAAGQLFNGILGDRISPKMMIAVGTAVSGFSMCVFPFVSIWYLQIGCFALLGYALSMVRGPLMKIICEKTKPNHARQICVFFSFASFAGPLIASMFALIYNWKLSFIAAGVTGIFAAVVAFWVFSTLEKKNLISYKSSKGEGLGAITSVFKIEKFGFYLIIACIVEICAASISYWIPTYFTTELGFKAEFANLLYSGISIIRAMMPFVALAIFRATKEKDVAMMRVSLLVSAVFFALLIFCKSPFISVAVLLISLVSMSCTSALLWSIYIPGLGNTGKVSSINGVIDCTGYIAAALANMAFAVISTTFGWTGIYIIWSLLAISGLIATLLLRKKSSKQSV